MQAANVIVIFLVATIKKQKGTSEVDFNDTFYLTSNTALVLSFQHVISIKINEIFYILIFIPSL